MHPIVPVVLAGLLAAPPDGIANLALVAPVAAGAMAGAADGAEEWRGSNGVTVRLVWRAEGLYSFNVQTGKTAFFARIDANTFRFDDPPHHCIKRLVNAQQIEYSCDDQLIAVFNKVVVAVADEARAFLQGSLQLWVNDAAGNLLTSRASVDCERIEVAAGAMSYAFNPRLVTLRPRFVRSVEGGEVPVLRTECIATACIAERTPQGVKQQSSVILLSGGVETDRVARAFEAYQQHCGGPIRSNF